MSLHKFIGLSLVSLGISAGCTDAPMTSEELAQDEAGMSIDDGAMSVSEDGSMSEIGELQEGLCANGDGVNSAMAALAVAAARELGRWQPTTDFTQHSSPWSLILTSAGKARCADGRCWNTQAILDLQKAPPNSVKFGNVVFNANNFVSTLVARWNEQRNCEARGGTGAQNCTAEQHKLTFVSSKPGACDTIFTFNAQNTSGGALKAPSQLKNKLMFVGYPSNPYLAFSSTGTTVSIDPTFGLNAGANTTTGSCSAICTKISNTSAAGACCSCNGRAGKYVKSLWNASTFLCQ